MAKSKKDLDIEKEYFRSMMEENDIAKRLRDTVMEMSDLQKEMLINKVRVLNLDKTIVNVSTRTGETWKKIKNHLREISDLSIELVKNQANIGKGQVEAVDISKELLVNEKTRAFAQKEYNKGILKRDEFSKIIKILDTEKARLDVIKDISTEYEMLDKIIESQMSLVDDMFGDVFGFIQKLPGGSHISKTLNLGKVFEDFSEDIRKAVSSGVGGLEADFNLAQIAGEKAFAGITNAAKSTFKFIASNPYILAIAGIVLLLKSAYDRFVEIDAAAESVREETGLLRSQMKEVDKIAVNINYEYQRFGVNLKEAYAAATALRDVTNETYYMTKRNIEVVALLSKNYGISEDVSAAFLINLQKITGISESMVDNYLAGAIGMTKIGKVAPVEILTQIAELSEDAANYLARSPKMLIESAYYAHKLGIELRDMADAANDLLDLETSIENEMMAQALLGKNINLNYARQLAIIGDLPGMTKELLYQVGKLGDFTKLNVIEYEAIAAAVGISTDNLRTMLSHQSRLSEMTEEQARSYLRSQIAMGAMDDIEADRLFKERQMQGVMTNLGNIWNDITLAVSDVFLPVIKSIGSVVNSIVERFGGWYTVTKAILWVIMGIVAAFVIIPVIVAAIHGGILAIVGVAIALSVAIVGIINNLRNIEFPSWVPFIGGGGKEVQEEQPIEHPVGMQSGGTVVKGGLVKVGETGPEIVELPTNARVTSHEGTSFLESKIDELITIQKELLIAIKSNKGVFLDGRKVGETLALARS